MENLGQFSKPPLPSRSGSRTGLEPRNREICSPSIVADRVRVLLGSYRRGDADDPEIYTNAVARVLSYYPESVVVKVTDPVTGLPGSSQWLPTVFEVRHACEVEMGPARRAAEREQQRRELLKAIADDGPPRETRKTFAELREAYPDVVGRSPKAPKLPPTEAQKKTILADLDARKPYFRSPFLMSLSLEHLGGD